MAKKLSVLSVGSLSWRNQISIFRKEQAESLIKLGIAVDYFNIKGHGFTGYLKNYRALKKIINSNSHDLIHAHYGLSGMLSVLQRKVPVVITFHGSDVWNVKIRFISLIASYLSAWNIFISEKLRKKASFFRGARYSIIPCGVNLSNFFHMERSTARKQLSLDENGTYILFSSSFDNPVKNYPLAKRAMDLIPGATLLELKGYSKTDVNYLMNACHALLITSHYESGPLVAKEAMACNLPVVSVDVGDVSRVVAGTTGCHVVSYDPQEISSVLKTCINMTDRTDGRMRVMCYGLEEIAKQIKQLFISVLKKSGPRIAPTK